MASAAVPFVIFRERFFSPLFPELLRVHTLRLHVRYGGLDAREILAVRHAVPGLLARQHLHAREPCVHLLIRDPRQEVLRLERIFRQDLANEILKSLVERAHHPLAEAPEVHGYERIAGKINESLAIGRVGGVVAALFNVCPLGDRGEEAVCRFAHAARDIPVFGNGIAHAIPDHGVLALRHRLGEKIIERAERPRAVKIVGR